ncbi:hypothetical protein HMPREF0742_02069 [Rothia aeria F0184]|uniref:Uncharacterized protein n=1 Tax=Rothia aeria F0184 TaxID=888019 RepID=U7V255_9MICC|nr:hypothetical protein HMPREF0742_02069 [Rothia aeria F0184]
MPTHKIHGGVLTAWGRIGAPRFTLLRSLFPLRQGRAQREHSCELSQIPRQHAR